MSRFVAVLMGSESDLPVMQEAVNVLQELDIPYEVRILSAHRTPEATRSFVVDAQTRGCGVFIAGAGLAAHLAGAIAAHTVRPVIGVPIDAGPLQGLDALLSTVQMPGGVPVATVAIGKAGARNAGHLAAQILALADAPLEESLVRQRAAATERVLERDTNLRNGG
jgi:5-(carboxyamino)imidazole ribonucleotide mutase